MIFKKTLIKCLLLREFGEYTIIRVLGQASPTAKSTGLLHAVHVHNPVGILTASNRKGIQVPWN